MRVVVGPVSAHSAREWISYATRVVDELDDLAPGACFATPEVREVFDGYLTAWRREARSAGDFCWERDIPAEQVEYHVHALHQVATVLTERAEASGVHNAPDEGQEFYAALLRGVLNALEAEGPASASFARHLGEFWPGDHLSLR